MVKEMNIESHKGESRGSERSHSRKREKENAKENGILNQLTDEEYEKEKAKIAVHLELLMKLLQENTKAQRHGWNMRKRVKWQRLQQKRDQQINMQLTEELKKLEQMMSIQLRCEELRATELKVEVSIDEIEKEIIDDFLSYWADPHQLDNVNSCVFIADNCDVITGFTEEDAQSCEAVTSMEKTLSGDKYSEEESRDVFILEVVVVQEGVLVNEEEDQLEELAYKPIVETIELCDFQTEDLCVSAGTISDSEMLQQCV